MNILADENVERVLVAWLREQGHDVRWVVETLASTADEALVGVARNERRVILTYDLDFGHLVYRERVVCEGVILLRCKGLKKWERLAWFQRWWPKIERHAIAHFTVLRNNTLRVRPLARQEPQ